MAKRRRRSGRMDILDWWQNIMDETKDFLDDTIDRVRDDDDDDDLADDVADLKKAVAGLNAKLDQLLTESTPSRAKTTA
jgi:hypothetical protein